MKMTWMKQKQKRVKRKIKYNNSLFVQISISIMDYSTDSCSYNESENSSDNEVQYGDALTLIREGNLSQVKQVVIKFIP